VPIPNTITRTLDLPHPQDRVWAALTTIEGLTSWFGSHAEGFVVPGRVVRMRWEQYDDGRKDLAIKVVEPMSRFAFTWAVSGAPEGDPRQTFVEFLLEPTAAGTLLTVTESGFAQLPDEWLEPSYEGNVEGWGVELGELVAFLDAA